eukprot:TRINITY_DN12847_c0_g4_i1.p1 TRINITY_DN12847_c0_g4~~TRINITY_DN12847_c0_g4_i1.p1  ORF type:complete len:1172 (+),score=175.39 TRINITY_DN12847_c0_g4_i1:62-3517(+)
MVLAWSSLSMSPLLGCPRDVQLLRQNGPLRDPGRPLKGDGGCRGEGATCSGWMATRSRCAVLAAAGGAYSLLYGWHVRKAAAQTKCATSLRSKQEGQLAPRRIADRAAAFAKDRELDQSMWRALLVEADRSAAAGGFSPVDLAKLSWAIAAARLAAEQSRLERFATLAKPSLRTLGSRDLTNFAWALSKCRAGAADFFDEVMAQAMQKMAAFGARDISSFAWALASSPSKRECTPVVALLVRRAQSKLDEFSAQGLANLAWALASLDCANADVAGAAFVGHLLRQCSAKLREFNSQNLANLLWAMAKLEAADTRLMRQVLIQATGASALLKPQEVSSLLWACGSLVHKPADDSFVVLAEYVQAKLAGFSSQHIANIVWSIAKLEDGKHNGKSEESERIETLLGTLAEGAAGRQGSFKPQELSSMSWAFSALQYSRDETLLAMLCKNAVLLLGQHSAQGLSTLARSLVRLSQEGTAERDKVSDCVLKLADQAASIAKHHELPAQAVACMLWAVANSCGPSRIDEETLSVLLHVTRERLASFKPEELSMVAVALAKLSTSDEEGIYETIADVAIRIGAELQAQEVANIAWAFASAKVVHRPLQNALATRFLVGTQMFAPQELANVAWSFATLLQANMHVFRTILATSSPRLSEFKPRELSSLAWSLPTVSVSVAGVATEFSAAIQQLHGRLSAQSLSNLAWSFATSMSNDLKIFEVLATEALPTLDHFESQDLSNFAWAFATVAASDATLFDALAQKAIKELDEFKTQELSMLAWAFATLAFQDTQLFKGISRMSVQKSAYMSAQSCSNIVWSFGRLQLGDLELFQTAERQLVQDLGQAMDETALFSALELRPSQVSSTAVQSAQNDHEPTIVLDLSDRLVLHKPPGWEAAVTQELGKRRKNTKGSLPAFLQQRFPVHQHPVVHDPLAQHGILHRLDVPCSGLILVTLTYEAHGDLKVQLDQGSIERDYAVICHGWIPPCVEEVNARIHWKHDSAAACTVAANGKPALTWLKVVAYAERRRRPYSAVLIRIDTGRRHQIRTHTSHIGHPTVCDGKYTSSRTFQADKYWCARNFIHRYRLGFRDGHGDHQEAVAPLPPDMRSATLKLRPRDAESARALHSWCRPVAAAWRSWAAYARLQETSVQGPGGSEKGHT